MNKLPLLLIISVLTLGCEKEEQQLTEEEFEKKDYLEKKIKGYPISTFQVWIDESNNYLLDITLSEILTFELIPEDSELKVNVTNINGEKSTTITHVYKYSNMVDVYHYQLLNGGGHGIVVTLNENYPEE